MAGEHGHSSSSESSYADAGPAKPAGQHANLYALGAIGLWATLASLGVSLKHVPPFLLTGLALLIGSLPAWPLIRQWKVPPLTLALGVYGLFGFHFLLFIALRHAPPVEANLVNYLWPLFIVILAPLFLPGLALKPAHVVAAVAGFAGAAIAILGAGGASGGWSWGYLPALASAFIWASYSLWTRRVRAFPTAAIGLFGLVSGVLSLLCHVALEPAADLSRQDWGLIAVMGLGPLGAAFFLWDKALKQGDARHIGILSYLTPLASTALLMVVSGSVFSWSIGVAAVMIIGAAILGTRAH
jgi:drug/metabolite transporter (DMT)-like permease